MNDVPHDRLMYMRYSQGPSDPSLCHICLNPHKLTEEHIPPKSAFNDKNRLWDRWVDADVRPSKVRGGFWVETLCGSCNSGLCGKYAAEYVKFVHHLVESPTLFAPGGEARAVSIPCDTLLLAKELATMVVALENPTTKGIFGRMREFVRDPNAALESDFRIYGFLVPDVPEAGMIGTFQGRVDSFAPGFAFVGAEISYPPFGFVYTSNIGKGYRLDKLTDITSWFTNTDPRDRIGAVVSLYSRVTVVDSMQVLAHGRRIRPVIDDTRGHFRRP